MSSSKLNDLLNNAIQNYKDAYLDFKKTRTSESENTFFLTKDELNRVYLKLNNMKSNALDSLETLGTNSQNNIQKILKDKKSLNELKKTLSNIEDSSKYTDREKSAIPRIEVFSYFLWKEYIFLFIIVCVFILSILFMKKDITISKELFIQKIYNMFKSTKNTIAQTNNKIRTNNKITIK